MIEKLFVKLRFGFQAGYTLPQFCIVNKIKNPLFVMEKKSEWFLKEIYAQFYYDRRLFATFCFIDTNEEDIVVSLNGWLLSQYKIIKGISKMNINTFDKVILLTKKNLDINSDKILSFDELERIFLRQAYLEIPLLYFLQRYPKVKLFHVKFADGLGRYKGGAEFKKQVWSGKKLRQAILENKNNQIKTPFDKFGYTNSEVLELIKQPRSKRNLDGTSSLFDDNAPLQKIQNGKRMTAYQPDNYRNKIYFVGPSHYFGLCAPFDKTIESYLQKMLNENNLPYRVENEGQLYFNRFIDMFYNLNALNPAPGDIIFFHVWHKNFKSDIIPFFDLSDVFDPPYNYKEIFCTKSHVNELGYKIIAQRFFKFLTENNFFRDVKFNYPIPPPAYHRYGIPPWVEQGGVNTPVNEELETYKRTLRPKKLPVGALVMNCNPFTLGHLHLVEYAAAKVVKLYIFVVEEDKSEFPFADRIELVRQGVKNFSNVEVLPSGKFIISQQTFSGYFNKASLQDVAVDSSEDVEIFAKEIAPTLGITVRFAGEEPKDNVTRQYNENMKKILPRYGIEFCEIPRKELDGEPISASTIRKALKNGDFNKVKRFVPDTTFNYLLKQHAELKLHFTARVDIKLATTTDDFLLLSISDENAEVWKPTAWQQKGDIGYQIESYAGKLEFITKSTVEGQVNLSLLGLDVRTPEDYSKRIPYWIDYTKLIVNGQKIFDTVTSTWHDKPYHYNINAKANEEIKIQIEWFPHSK